MHASASLARKLRWRTHFLLSPRGFAERETFFSSRGEFPIRELLLMDAGRLSLQERVAFISTSLQVRYPIQDYLLLKRIRRAPDGCEYFDLGEQKIFFRPEHGITNESELLKGILMILKEAYVFPLEFFSPEVQIAPGDVIFDVGGNVGTSALLFSRLTGPGGRVFSFEPIFPEVLSRTVRESGIENVRVIPRGVSDASGTAEFAVTDLGIDSRIASPSFANGRRRRIDLITLDQFVEEAGLERVDFVKMDIEGAEELALRGAKQVIERFRPRWSIASYHTDPQGDKQHPKLISFLRKAGYRVREIESRHIYAW